MKEYYTINSHIILLKLFLRQFIKWHMWIGAVKVYRVDKNIYAKPKNNRINFAVRKKGGQGQNSKTLAIKAERRMRQVPEMTMQRCAQNAKNRAGNLTRIQPSTEHNNFSRDFKTVNFLPRNQRRVCYPPDPRLARGVRFCFCARKNRSAPCRIIWSRENQLPRSVIISHRLYNKAAGERGEERILEGSDSVLERQIDRERSSIYHCSRAGPPRDEGGRRNENEAKGRKKSCGFFQKKRGKRGTRGLRNLLYPLNKYIIMPAVPLACFQPHPRCLPCTGRFFPPSTKNRQRKKRALLSPGLTDKI